MNSPIQSLPLPEVYYLATGQDYFTPDDEGKWIHVNESSAKRVIRSGGYTDQKDGGMSEAEQCLLDIQRKQNVSYAGKLAGYDAGFYQVNGSKVLVTESPRLILPVQGERPLMRSIIDGMFITEGVDQRP